MPLETNLFKGTVKDIERMGRQPGNSVLVQLFCGAFEVVEGKALEDEHEEMVWYEEGDIVGVLYDPWTTPPKVLRMRKLNNLEKLYTDGGWGEVM